jgi:hypothetical protein
LAAGRLPSKLQTHVSTYFLQKEGRKKKEAINSETCEIGVDHFALDSFHAVLAASFRSISSDGSKSATPTSSDERALPAEHADQRGPFWMPVEGPSPTPIDKKPRTSTIKMCGGLL